MQVQWHRAALLLVVGLLVSQGRQTFAQDDVMPLEETFISKFDGTEQRYIIVLPREFRSDVLHDVVFALHGHGSDRWQFVKDVREECRGTRDAALERNAIFVSPDYRAKTSWMGPAATADVRQILDALHGKFRIRNIIISGGSMGGSSALAFAAMHPESVDAVVSLNGTANMLEYPNFADAIAESYGGSRQEMPDVYRERSAELFPERLAMPVATSTGGKDTLVPPDSVLRLMVELNRRGSPALSIHRPEGGHDTNYDDTRSAFRFVFEQLDVASKNLPAPTLQAFEKPITVVCLGDSVTGVYYHTGGRRAYPEILEIALKKAHSTDSIQVINAGISGHTTANGLERLDADVLRHKPTLVTISFGLNDLVRVPADQFRSNLQQLVDRCRAAGCQVMLCTPNAVIDTPDRPVTKLVEYCDIIRAVAREKMIPVCDQQAAGNRLKQRAPWTWRLTMSDAIHPNMDGHKRMAEELCRCISGTELSLDAVEPAQPCLTRTQQLLEAGMPIKVLAMEAVAETIEPAIQHVFPNAKIELTTWATSGKSLSQLEQESKDTVRAMKPNLVVLTIPIDGAAENDEQAVHSISWIMNWSLSFGIQEWDCVVVHPEAFETIRSTDRSELIRRLVHAQHLQLIGGTPPGGLEERMKSWFEGKFRANSK